MSEERDRINEILEALNDLKVSQAEVATEMKIRFESIETHFTRLNGSVSRHGDAIAQFPMAISQHAMACPTNVRIAALEASQVAHKATLEDSAKWYNELKGPVLSLVGFALKALLALMLLHSSGFLPQIITK